MDQALKRLQETPAVCVTVQAVRGSVPRGPGTAMLVFAQGECGTIGGGHLEYQAIAHARLLLSGQTEVLSLQQVLGPSLGQCCGGVVHLRFEALGAQDIPNLHARLTPARWPLALFGGGHVGRALVRVLTTLPCALTWVDSREGVFPDDLPPGVRCEPSEPVQAAVDDLVPGSAVLIMSFSHAEDLDIVASCLRRQRARADLDFIGLIGSRTKWATFRHRLSARGFTEAELAGVTCPIGLPGLRGKEPEVIAVSVAAQLLMRRSAPPPA